MARKERKETNVPEIIKGESYRAPVSRCRQEGARYPRIGVNALKSPDTGEQRLLGEKTMEVEI